MVRKFFVTSAFVLLAAMAIAHNLDRSLDANGNPVTQTFWRQQ